VFVISQLKFVYGLQWVSRCQDFIVNSYRNLLSIWSVSCHSRFYQLPNVCWMNCSLHSHQPSTRWVMLLVAYLTAVPCKCKGAYLPKYKADHLPLSTKVENECWIFLMPLWHGAYRQNVTLNKTLSQTIYYLHSSYHHCLFTGCTLHTWWSTY
jgi:hypothetical protein